VSGQPDGPHQLAEVLTKHRDSSGVGLLIRHARRERIADATAAAAFSAALTDQGREQARAFGAAVSPSSPVRLHYSPVPRCEDTAQLVAEGVVQSGGSATVGGPRRILGASFVKDERRLIATFATLGLRGFMRAWFNGELNPEVTEDPKQAGDALLGALLHSSEEAHPAAVEINVSHDVVVLALLGLAWDVADEAFPWPGFLDGVLYRRSETGAILWYRHEERELRGTFTPPPR